MKKIILILTLAITGGMWAWLGTAESADDAAPMDGATLYQKRTCFTCHGKDAQSPILPSYPKLAGQNSAYALQQMKDIKSGARANGMSAAMKAIMHLVTDEEMALIADYLESLSQ